MDLLSDIMDAVVALKTLVDDPSLRTGHAEQIDERFYALLEETNQQSEEDISEPAPWISSSISIVNFSVNCSVDDQQRALKICVPRPDELLNGWLGRMTSLNCEVSQAAMLARMLASARQVTPDIALDADVSQFGSVVLQVSQENFLRYLSFDAFNHALIGRSHNKPGNKSSRHLAAYERHAMLRLPSRHLRFCPECAQEDLTESGYSYWRREHQISGSLWCEAHDTPLRIALNKTATEMCPHQVDFYEETRLQQLSDEQLGILKRYKVIANTVLRHMPQINGAAASEVFAQQAKRFDLRTGKVGKRKTVSTYLQETLPLWWLTETFPRVKWRVDKHISAIDSACTPKNTQRYTTNTYSLLAAVFYERAEDAILTLMNPQRRLSREKGVAYWSKREIFDLYVENRGVVLRVAEKLNINPQTVHGGLKNQGLPAFGNSIGVRSAVTRFLAGQPLNEACLSVEELSATEAIIRAACTPCKAALDAMEKSEQNRLAERERQYGSGR